MKQFIIINGKCLILFEAENLEAAMVSQSKNQLRVDWGFLN